MLAWKPQRGGEGDRAGRLRFRRMSLRVLAVVGAPTKILVVLVLRLKPWAAGGGRASRIEDQRPRDAVGESLHYVAASPIPVGPDAHLGRGRAASRG